MAKLIYGLNQSLDGLRRACAQPDGHGVRSAHVRDHALLGPRPFGLGRGRTRICGGVAQPAEVVVSRSMKSAGPNATLVEKDVEAVIRALKSQQAGEIERHDVLRRSHFVRYLLKIANEVIYRAHPR